MAKKLNPEWVAKIESEIFQSQRIDKILDSMVAIKWLVAKLAGCKIPYKIHNLGAGVYRITTNTESCPCCGARLK